MPGIKLEGNIDGLINTIKNLEDFDYQGLNTILGEALLSSTKQRFKDEKDPKGKRWQPSIRAKEEGGQTLTDESELKNSIKSKATPEGFAVGTNKIYAGTHQLGGKFTIRAKNKKGLRFKINGKWITKKEVNVNMPKREFLGISKEDMAEIKATLEEKVRDHIDD
ncbi:phage virion morphogenesis protein [Maledivibacter halophilus]|uniref:Phage virion morphogenesis (Putative tail completion) protein n=1 Tax=Maledivibacter halophilus TaxID=36842 RepID=A0A1T5L8J9_9FIRM|nr:phage virion morphogenesis protein [Maledivibacter halophilus]SKC68296.1 phage virion morphogenesis (putative tail completion) protein [Maledivibacter halophilus]SKC71718.1 phage virion morphogenesis (putative tail completion) protein [Maledivibacter halophilus]SKC80179.1 phage virion morphogenesis (putative tail completion) protein [Maledivibacter halophilus]